MHWFAVFLLFFATQNYAAQQRVYFTLDFDQDSIGYTWNSERQGTRLVASMLENDLATLFSSLQKHMSHDFKQSDLGDLCTVNSDENSFILTIKNDYAFFKYDWNVAAKRHMIFYARYSKGKGALQSILSVHALDLTHAHSDNTCLWNLQDIGNDVAVQAFLKQNGTQLLIQDNGTDYCVHYPACFRIEMCKEQVAWRMGGAREGCDSVRVTYPMSGIVEHKMDIQPLGGHRTVERPFVFTPDQMLMGPLPLQADLPFKMNFGRERSCWCIEGGHIFFEYRSQKFLLCERTLVERLDLADIKYIGEDDHIMQFNVRNDLSEPVLRVDMQVWRDDCALAHPFFIQEGEPIASGHYYFPVNKKHSFVMCYNEGLENSVRFWEVKFDDAKGVINKNAWELEYVGRQHMPNVTSAWLVADVFEGETIGGTYRRRLVGGMAILKNQHVLSLLYNGQVIAQAPTFCASKIVNVVRRPFTQAGHFELQCFFEDEEDGEKNNRWVLMKLCRFCDPESTETCFEVIFFGDVMDSQNFSDDGGVITPPLRKEWGSSIEYCYNQAKNEWVFKHSNMEPYSMALLCKEGRMHCSIRHDGISHEIWKADVPLQKFRIYASPANSNAVDIMCDRFHLASIGVEQESVWVHLWDEDTLQSFYKFCARKGIVCFWENANLYEYWWGVIRVSGSDPEWAYARAHYQEDEQRVSGSVYCGDQCVAQTTFPRLTKPCIGQYLYNTCVGLEYQAGTLNGEKEVMMFYQGGWNFFSTLPHGIFLLSKAEVVLQLESRETLLDSMPGYLGDIFIKVEPSADDEARFVVSICKGEERHRLPFELTSLNLRDIHGLSQVYGVSQGSSANILFQQVLNLSFTGHYATAWSLDIGDIPVCSGYFQEMCHEAPWLYYTCYDDVGETSFLRFCFVQSANKDRLAKSDYCQLIFKREVVCCGKWGAPIPLFCIEQNDPKTQKPFSQSVQISFFGRNSSTFYVQFLKNKECICSKGLWEPPSHVRLESIGEGQPFRYLSIQFFNDRDQCFSTVYVMYAILDNQTPHLIFSQKPPNALDVLRNLPL